MTAFRSRTAKAIQTYPAIPVVYRRPVPRAFFAVFLIAGTAYNLNMLHDDSIALSDRFTAADWWFPVFVLCVFGSLYEYSCSRLVVDGNSVLIRNPFGRVRIPLAHITEVVPAWHLRLSTSYGGWSAWGVEAANAQMAADNYGTQGDLVRLISQAALEVDDRGESPARYRVSSPDWLYWVCAALLVYSTVATLRLG